MVNRAAATFVVAITRAIFQMIAAHLAGIVDRNTPVYYYMIGYDTLFLTSFIAFWSASHILEDWKGRITWPSIIFGVHCESVNHNAGLLRANFAGTEFFYVTLAWSILVLIIGPLVMILGIVLGFSAVRQYSREQGHAVLCHN